MWAGEQTGVERRQHALFSLVCPSVGACGSGYTNGHCFFIGWKITENGKMQTALISVMLCGELRRKYPLSQAAYQ